MGSEADALLSPLADSIASAVNLLKLRRFEKSNAETAKSLKENLLQQPISSRRRRSDEDIFSGLSLLRSRESTPDQVYGALAEFDEIPVAASEILAAGWLYRLSAFEAVLVRTFPEAGRNADLRVYGKYVEKTDGMLQKSLELAAVHAEVLRRLAPAC